MAGTVLYCTTVTFPCWKVSLYPTLQESIVMTFLYFLESYMGKHCCHVPLLESMAITLETITVKLLCWDVYLLPTVSLSQPSFWKYRCHSPLLERTTVTALYFKMSLSHPSTRKYLMTTINMTWKFPCRVMPFVCKIFLSHPAVGKLLLKSSWVTLLQLLVKVTRYF